VLKQRQRLEALNRSRGLVEDDSTSKGDASTMSTMSKAADSSSWRSAALTAAVTSETGSEEAPISAQEGSVTEDSAVLPEEKGNSSPERTTPSKDVDKNTDADTSVTMTNVTGDDDTSIQELTSMRDCEGGAEDTELCISDNAVSPRDSHGEVGSGEEAEIDMGDGDGDGDGEVPGQSQTVMAAAPGCPQGCGCSR